MARGSGRPDDESERVGPTRPESDGSATALRALAAWEDLEAPTVVPHDRGLIHRSYFVRDRDSEYVLQRVSPIFEPGIHQNILAVTEHLRSKGLPTLRLLLTRKGEPTVDLGEAGVWRLMTRVPGESYARCTTIRQARAAANLVARFHGALADLDYEFQPVGIPLHDTARHVDALREALELHRGHRHYDSVARLAEEIFEGIREWESQHLLDGLPKRVVHGDLKFNNILFDADGVAVSLIDLDTVTRNPLILELGDAWRSWCNRAGESTGEAALDLELFRASVEGYLAEPSIELVPIERLSLALGLDIISLELCARFATDALRESYFAWDASRFDSAGDHNLLRAQGQLSLYHQACATRTERIRVLAGGD